METNDKITVQDEQGTERDFHVEALFDMDDNTYAMLSDRGDTFLMKVENKEGEQFLVPVESVEEIDSILDAYEIAMEADENNPEHYDIH